MENSIFDRASQIETEFAEPLRDVVAGFIPLGMTRREIADTLEVNPTSLQRFCAEQHITFPDSRTGHFADQARDARRDRIRRTKRARAPQLSLNGESLSVAEWAERAGLGRHTLHMRLRRGKSLRDAIA